jgi:osmotically-inducible protein OsmY
VTRGKENSVQSNDELRRNVKEALAWEPQVEDPKAIAVSAEDGRVTLRGTVGGPREKLAASKAAKGVWGVVAVDNELEVRLLDKRRRDDADVRADVLQALMLNSLVPDTIDVNVDHGLVTLTGKANWNHQRIEAERVASAVVGTFEVVDEIELHHLPSPNPAAVEDAITAALRRSATLDARKLHVSTSNGTVTIKGHVRSWPEHDDAIAAAWAAPGVKEVHDRIQVDYGL